MTEDLITGAEHWRRIRRLMNDHRQDLAAMAAGLYPDLPRVAGTDLLCWPGWLPATPLDLADVPLRWVSDPPPPAVAVTGAAAAHVLPWPVTGQAYPTYTAAIEALDRPALFENRVCYQLLDADLDGAARSSRFDLSLRTHPIGGCSNWLCHEQRNRCSPPKSSTPTELPLRNLGHCN